MSLTINNNQPEAMLLRGVTNFTEKLRIIFVTKIINLI